MTEMVKLVSLSSTESAIEFYTNKINVYFLDLDRLDLLDFDEEELLPDLDFCEGCGKLSGKAVVATTSSF